MTEFFTTPPKIVKDPSRNVMTSIAYQERCGEIPTAFETTRRIHSKADFTGFSASLNVKLVGEWLVKYFSKRKQVLIGPDFTVHERSFESVDFWYDSSDMKSFVRTVCVKRKLGITTCGFADEHMNGHAVLCVWDGTISNDRLNVYFIDPSGSNEWSQRFVKHCRLHFSYKIQRYLINSKSVKSSFSIHTYTVNTPDLNDNYTIYMESRDRQENLHEIKDSVEGFCQPWVYVFLIDVMCTKKLFLSRGHYYRMYSRSGGESKSKREQQYKRLLYLRHVMSWISDNMFNPKDSMFEKNMANWRGNIPINPFDYSDYVTIKL